MKFTTENILEMADKLAERVLVLENENERLRGAMQDFVEIALESDGKRTDEVIQELRRLKESLADRRP